jgi:type IV secretion/conjugal transfer VirB4 family ATPase
VLALREFRSAARGLADLLNYAAVVDDGVILNKDGSLLAGWSYRGEDLDSASAVELEALSARVNAVFARRGSGWMLHVDALRSPARGYPAAGAFQDRTTLLIDQERRATYEAEGSHYESRYVLIVTYLPPVDAEHAVTSFFVDGERPRGSAHAASQALETFGATLVEIEDNLSATMRLRRLRAERVVDRFGGAHIQDELLRHLVVCLTGDDHPVNLPPVPMYLDAILGAQDFYGGLRPRIGRRHIRTIAITGFPAESYPGILDFLNRMPLCYRWSTRFILLDAPAAHRQINRYRSRWWQKRKSLRNLLREHSGSAATHVDADADAMAADAVAAVAEASSGTVKFGYYTTVIVLMDEEESAVDAAARSVLKAINHAGFVARLEDVNAVEAFLGSLPGHGYPNVRRPLLHTLNLADLLPLTSIWPGLDQQPCPFYPPQSPPLAYAATTGATPFRLNLHVGDVGHSLIVGPTGSGKSTLLAFLLAQHLRYPDAQVFAFDKGYSLYVLCSASGGAYYEIGVDSGPTFMPLAGIDTPHERHWAQEWLETLVTLQGITATPTHRRALHRALELLCGSPSRTLTDLVNTVQDQTLRDALTPYTLAGPLGRLLDADEDGLGDDTFAVFELDHIASLGEKNLVPVLLYLFHRIERRLAVGRPTLIALGEAWLALSHTLFREKIREWLKTLRKTNGAAILETQSISDITNSQIRDVIIESCPTKIFLPNAEARTEHAAGAYEALGLSQRQIELVAHAVPKRHYYYTSPLGRRLFELGLGPVALSFLGAASREDLAAARLLIARYPETWPAEWLRRRGLSEAADRWMNLSPPAPLVSAAPLSLEEPTS